MRSFIITTILLFLSTLSFSQQRPPFSDKPVIVKDRPFLPYTKGEIKKEIQGPQKAILDKICSIITSWDSIKLPQGIDVYCSGYENTLEVHFLPYLFDDNIRYPAESGPNFRIHVNNPGSMFGGPIVSDIFLCPEKIIDFNGFPIYQNDRMEVTVVTKKNIPLFIPVTQEEYLKALIRKEEKNNPENTNPDYQSTLQEMEKAYKLLLETDKDAAKEFKQQMEEFRNETSKDGSVNSMIDMVSLLKNELAGLTAEEKSRHAYYGGPWAMEEYHNASCLVPCEKKDMADALVRPNPALINTSNNQVQLLVISWSLFDDNHEEDKPRLYKDGREGFHLADDLMVKLYNNKQTWINIFNLVN